MKTSEAFKLAMKKLWDGHGKLPQGLHASVCGAAQGANVEKIVGPIIMKLLDTDVHLGNWLKYHHGIDAYADWEKYQQTRHAWVDHLIQHYESIGD